MLGFTRISMILGFLMNLKVCFLYAIVLVGTRSTQPTHRPDEGVAIHDWRRKICSGS